MQVKFKCLMSFRKAGNLYTSYSFVSVAIITGSNTLYKLSGTSSKIM